MDMHMHSRLPRGLPNIYPDVVPVGRMLGTNQLVGLSKKLELCFENNGQISPFGTIWR